MKPQETVPDEELEMLQPEELTVPNPYLDISYDGIQDDDFWDDEDDVSS